MNVFVTGPSGAGKSSFCRQFGDVRTIRIDATPWVRVLEEAVQGQARATITLFEGLPFGRRRTAAQLVALMDAILLLESPLTERAARVWRRDGATAMPRWVFNEACWYAFCLPVLRGSPVVRQVRWMPGDSGSLAFPDKTGRWESPGPDPGHRDSDGQAGNRVRSAQVGGTGPSPPAPFPLNAED